jgi:hypothetical protein
MSRRAPHANSHRPRVVPAGRDLSVTEAAWVVGESAHAIRRMCEQGLLGAWRVVDPSARSARLRWHIPSQSLAPLLRTEAAHRRLEALLAGEVQAPRRSRPASTSEKTPTALTPGSLLTLDPNSDSRSNKRFGTSLSHDTVVRKQMMIDNVSEEAP